MQESELQVVVAFFVRLPLRSKLNIIVSFKTYCAEAVVIIYEYITMLL